MERESDSRSEVENQFSGKPLITPEYLPSLEKFASANSRRLGEKMAILEKHKVDTLKVLDDTSG